MIELLEKKNDFTNAEVQIADYLLNNPYKIKNMTAEQLGRVTFTSKSSVFRLCKKLCVESFQDLKIQIEDELREQQRLEAILKKEPFNGKSTLSEILNLIPTFYDSALRHTKMQLEVSILQKVIKQLREADKVEIYGVGITYSCAMTAEFKFLSLGKECSVYNAINEHYEVATNKRKKIAFVLSFTGKNPGMIKIAKYLKKQKVTVVGIGGGGKDDLQKYCDSYLEIYQKYLVSGMEMMTPYISITYIFDILFASLLVYDFEKHMKDAMEVQHIVENSKSS